MRELGVFVLDGGGLHLQFERDCSRLPRREASVRAHWRASTAPDQALVADLIDAVAQACRCQPPRAAIATLDSALNRRIIDDEQLRAVMALLPRAYRRLEPLIDGRAEAGTETLVRLMVRALGHRVEPQVRVAGVGRVDLLIDGWLIVECDSREFHGTLAQQLVDRRRDVAAASHGYVTLRLLAEDVLFRPEVVLTALRGVLGAPRTAARRRPQG